MRTVFLLFLLPLFLFAQSNSQPPRKSPQEIQQELDAANAQFEKAKKIFNPWYTGPLVTPSASMMPPGECNIQPYIFIADNYAAFNEDRHSVSLPNNLISLQSANVILTGITDSMDINMVPTATANWQAGEFGGGFNDLAVTAGFLIFNQTVYIPQFKFTVAETFPTGKYQNLSFNGLNLNSTGGGAFSTQLGFNMAKLLFWDTQHPLNTRLFLGYEISTDVDVENFNTYGGGFGTDGTVHPGDVFSADLGLELSLNQRWVLALDVVYKAVTQTTFNGNPGLTSAGTPAAVGGGSNDNLSLAPAIEYNWGPCCGFIAGAWFSVYGRNSLNFAQAVLSATWVFP